MAQAPFKVDQLQIEPGSTGTRTIRRKSGAQDIQFVDPANPSGVTLSELVGSGTAAIASVFRTGTFSVASATTYAVTISPVYADAAYTVSLEFAENPSAYSWVTDKTSNGFTVNFSSTTTVDVAWTTIRLGG